MGYRVQSDKWIAGDGEVYVLRDQPRMIRVAAIPHFDKLTAALIEKAKEFKKTLSDARSKA